MGDDAAVRQELLKRIRERRAHILAYVNSLQPRWDLLTSLSIICSAVVAALTAGPALGGTKFTQSAQSIVGLPDDTFVWRLLCLAAMILSIVAAVLTNLYKSGDVAARLTKAQACGAELEGLEALVEFGQLAVSEAAKLYQQYVNEIPFVPDPIP